MTTKIQIDYSSDFCETIFFRKVPVGGMFFLADPEDRSKLGNGLFIKTETDGFVALTGANAGCCYVAEDLIGWRTSKVYPNVNMFLV